MKLTKNRLNQIIQEELNRMLQEWVPRSASGNVARELPYWSEEAEQAKQDQIDAVNRWIQRNAFAATLPADPYPTSTAHLPRNPYLLRNLYRHHRPR